MAERPTRSERRRLVLLGAGHAHLYTLKRTSAFVERGIEVVLVSPGVFWYSGLATGMLGGSYPPELDQVDAQSLVEAGGGRAIRDRAALIDPRTRTVYLERGSPLHYDVLSMNVGSRVDPGHVPGAGPRSYPVKPIERLRDLRRTLEMRLERSTSAGPVRIVVIGGGSSGCEAAANVRSLAIQCDGPAEIILLADTDRLAPQLPAGASKKLERTLAALGIDVRLGSHVDHVIDGAAVLGGEGSVRFDVLVNATGLVPPAIAAASGLPTDRYGALVVDRHLRSVARPNIFGAGDCVTLEDRKLAKIGVYAVREAPVLHHNLLATLEGHRLKRFRPQRQYLLILNLGDGTGLATWGPLHWKGKLAFRLKDWLDRRWLGRYQK